MADDNPVNLEVAVAMLGTLDCEVDMAHDGIEVLDQLRPGEHALVLMEDKATHAGGRPGTSPEAAF